MSKSKAKLTRQKARAAEVPASPLARLVPVVVAGIFLLGIFLLPYHIPLKTPSDSQSWEFGFNNTVAQGLIALMLLALFAWMLITGRGKEGNPIAQVFPEEPEPFQVRPLIYTMGILQMFNIMILLIWYSILPLTHYGEMTYFIQRTEAAIIGQVPYVNFAFDYGPAMLAMPVGIYHLFGGALSVEAAYTATLIIHYIIGFALLAYIISQINTRGRVVLMAINGFHFVNLTMGLNYTPLRFTVALASLFALRHLQRVTRERPQVQRMLLLGAAGFFLPLINFSISPEMGIALTVALVVYFFWFVFGPDRLLAPLALTPLAGAAVTAVVFPRPYFDSILSFGGGGANFPIFPTLHIVAFLAAAIWIFPRLGIFAVRDRSAVAPFCAGLAFMCGMFILPATGRCDPGHIWLNSLGLFLVALSAASWLKPRWWYAIWGVYFVIFPLMDEISFWDNYAGQIQGVIAARSQLAGVHYDADNYAHLAPGDPKPPIHYSKLLPMDGLETLPQAKIGLPMGDNEPMERFFKLTGRYVPEYHIPPYSDVFAAADMDRKFQDMRNMDYIFLPSSAYYYLRPVDMAAQAQAQAAADNKFLSSLLLFPVDLPLVHPLLQPDRDIALRIVRDYKGLVKEYNGGVLLKRTSP